MSRDPIGLRAADVRTGMYVWYRHRGDWERWSVWSPAPGVARWWLVHPVTRQTVEAGLSDMRSSRPRSQ